MTRQYIGARYVFKVYTNSVNPSSAEWEENVSYEPLTIVTYMNSSYASKKEVPANIGNPASNPEYWVVTGAYNGQISALQAAVENLNNAVNSINEEIEVLPKLVKYEYGDITLTRYSYTYYLIDVVKINRTNQDGSINKPIVNGSRTVKSLYELSKDSMAAMNGGFFVKETGVLAGDLLANGEYIEGTPMGEGSFKCYLAIDDDGKFVYYPMNTDLETLPSNIQNALLVWCPLLENGAVSSLVKQDNVNTQQQIGYDTDMNYYIITTSYKCPLTYVDMANWIRANIPNADTFYAVDSGGSTQTTVANVRTNLESDLSNKEGRQIASCIYFPKANSGNLDVISSVIKQYQDNHNVRKIFANNLPDLPIATGIALRYTSIYQIGNLVIGNACFNVDSTYTPNSWVAINSFLRLPCPDARTLFSSSSIGIDKLVKYGRMEVAVNQNQIETDVDVEVKFSEPGEYDFTIVYVTVQNV